MFLCRDGDGNYWLSNTKPYKRNKSIGYNFWLWDKEKDVYWKTVNLGDIDSLGGELNYGQVRDLNTFKVVNYAFLNQFKAGCYYV
jgi:hypothetical protein